MYKIEGTEDDEKKRMIITSTTEAEGTLNEERQSGNESWDSKKD